MNPYDVEDLLERLTGHATDVFGAAGAGIMLVGREGGLDFAAASSSIVTDAERHQDHARSGACHDADTAFALLRQTSMNSNRKLRDVAVDVAQSHVRA